MPMYINLTPRQPDDLAQLQLVKAKFAGDGFKPETVDIGSVFLKPDGTSTE